MTHHHHAHGEAHRPQVRSSPSLLRLSAGQRLAIAAIVVAALWAAILWAIDWAPP